MKVKLRDPAQGRYIPHKGGGHLEMDENATYQAWSPEDIEDDEFDTAILYEGNVYLVNGIDLEWIYDEPETHSFEPPLCPFCGEPLESLRLAEKTGWIFDARDGTYNEEVIRGYLITMCARCGGDLPGEMFPEGPINY